MISIKKDYKDMTIRERFDSKGYAVKKYSTAYGVNQAILSLVLNGTLAGKNNINGDTRKIIAQLKKDRVWLGKLPWE